MNQGPTRQRKLLLPMVLKMCSVLVGNQLVGPMLKGEDLQSRAVNKTLFCDEDEKRCSRQAGVDTESIEKAAAQVRRSSGKK